MCYTRSVTGEFHEFQKFFLGLKIKEQDVNQDSHIASSPIAQSFFFEDVRCLILASSQRKLRGYIEVFKFDATIKKIQIRLKFKGLDLFLQNSVSNITQYQCINTQNFSLINRNLPELENFEKILKKFKIRKHLNASTDFGQIQYQNSLMDVIYLCEVLGQQFEICESQSYLVLFTKNSKSHKITNRALIVMKIFTIKGL